MVVFDGKCVVKELPQIVMRTFRREGIENPFYSHMLEGLLENEEQSEDGYTSNRNWDEIVFADMISIRQGGSI